MLAIDASSEGCHAGRPSISLHIERTSLPLCEPPWSLHTLPVRAILQHHRSYNTLATALYGSTAVRKERRESECSREAIRMCTCTRNVPNRFRHRRRMRQARTTPLRILSFLLHSRRNINTTFPSRRSRWEIIVLSWRLWRVYLRAICEIFDHHRRIKPEECRAQ